MNGMKEYLQKELDTIEEEGLRKKEEVIISPQGPKILLRGNKEVLNFCSNNYLGLSSHPEVIQAAKDGLDKWGYGLSSVRFICGTQEIHSLLEKKVSSFLMTEDTILYSSCFDANTGLFETILAPEDAVLSDTLNHASIIDGIRLCKAERFRYQHADMEDLEAKLQEARKNRFRLIATDGVFSMDGAIAPLEAICTLAEKYDAFLMVDDSHATGVLGSHGRGTPEYCKVMGRVDIVTGTFGKALGGATGGFVSGRKEIIALLRQRSRPYLFSNSLAPLICSASLKAFEILESSPELLSSLSENTIYFRRKMAHAGFDILQGEHPIVPIMLGDAKRANRMAKALFEKGIYVVGFSYPVVPKGKARIRVQVSAAHRKDDLDRAVQAFSEVGKEYGIG
ncbi:MAG: glycine C-acetyltransferase [Candidatus Ratteibacteria bacterium]|jgi:glycine C-acetyltransferase